VGFENRKVTWRYFLFFSQKNSRYPKQHKRKQYSSLAPRKLFTSFPTMMLMIAARKRKANTKQRSFGFPYQKDNENKGALKEREPQLSPSKQQASAPACL